MASVLSAFEEARASELNAADEVVAAVLLGAVKRYTKFVHHVLLRRRNLGMSQEILAQRVGVNQPWISQFERMSSEDPAPFRAFLLAEALGIDLQFVDRESLDLDENIAEWNEMEATVQRAMEQVHPARALRSKIPAAHSDKSSSAGKIQRPLAHVRATKKGTAAKKASAKKQNKSK